MTSIKSKEFKRVYITFVTMLMILCSAYIVFMLFFIDICSTNIIKILSLIFIFLIIIIGIGFVYTLRKKVLKTILSLEYIIESAINEGKVVSRYDETLLSSFEHKILKYVKINKSNKEAIEYEKNKVKTLVADISHQTKTPIANILLYSQLVLENEDIDEYTKDILNDINKQSQRLDFLIQSLIKMSRLENGIINPIKNETKIMETISKAVQEVYFIADKKQIQISVYGDKDIKGHYDSKWTIEAIVNILENAIKYTKENGTIEINLASYELFKRIDIKDNGIGIEENEINNIFKRFYRCSNVNQYDGVGIGLYLCREIITSQGGYIKVSSTIGQGSTFSIFLPS